MTSEIPVIADGSEYDYTESIELDGAAHTFRFLWSARAERWSLSVSLEGVPIISCRPLVYGVDLFDRAQGPRPVGALVLLTLRGEGEGATPGRYDLGSVARLYYVTT